MSENQFETEIRVSLSKFWDDDLTNAEVSQATGIHTNTISKYRNGAIQPRVDILWKLRAFFEQRLKKKISLEDLIETREYRTVKRKTEDPE